MEKDFKYIDDLLEEIRMDLEESSLLSEYVDEDELGDIDLFYKGYSEEGTNNLSPSVFDTLIRYLGEDLSEQDYIKIDKMLTNTL